MKNIIKIISISLSAILLAASMASCQLSQVLPNDKDKPESSDSSGSDTKIPDTEDEVKHEKMDLLNEDLTKYITLGNYKGFKLETESDKLTDKEYDEYIQKILSSKATPEEITDRKTKEGDTLNIDFEGYMNDEKFDNGSATGQTITLTKDNGYIDGFDADLYNIMPGTTVSTTVTFPEPYPNDPTKAGKEAVFKIKVNYIHGEDILPELNDEFVRSYTDDEYKTVAEFEEYVRKNLEENKVISVEEAEKQSAWDAALKNCAIIEVPQQQIDYYYYADRSYYEAYASMYGMTYEQMLNYAGTTDEEIKSNAYSNALDDIFLYSMVLAENLTLTDDEYPKMLTDFSKRSGMSVSYLLSNYGEQTLKLYFQTDKVKTFLRSNSEYTIKPEEK